MSLIESIMDIWIYWIYALAGLIILFAISKILFKTGWLPDSPAGSEGSDLEDMPTSTRAMPNVSETFEVPEEDQEYLLPLTVAILKNLAFSKRVTPTNAMLLEHLAESLQVAAESFTPRKNNSERPETGNEMWLMVAAYAIRIYDEGTPHNCGRAREAFVTEGTLASRRLMQWARQLNTDIAQKVKQGMVKESDVADVTSHVQTISGTPYTADEIEDLKKAFDAGGNKFEQALNRRKK